MKNKILIYILFFSFILLLLPVSQNILAIPNNYVKLSDFDDFVFGSSSGSDSYIGYERKDGDHFNIQGSVGDYYLYLKGYESNPEEDIGFINSSSNFSGFYVYTDGYSHDSYHSSYHYTYFEWKNSTNNETVVKMMRKDHASATNNEIGYYLGGTYYKLWTITRSEEYYIGWIFSNQNIIYYFVYDESWNLLKGQLAIGFNSSQTSEGNYTVNSLYVYNSFSGESYPGYIGWCKIDNYGYIQLDIYGEDSFPELFGVVSRVYINGKWVYGLPDICVGGTVGFEFTAIGEEGCRMCICIGENAPMGESIFYECSESETISFYHTFNENKSYEILIWDYFNYPDGYNAEWYFDAYTCGMPDYDDIFGNFYAEFYTTGSKCYYLDGDNPGLIYHFNDSTNYSTTDGTYILKIYSLNDVNGTCLYTTYVHHGDKQINRIIEGIRMFHTNDYIIRIYNTTKGVTTYLQYKLIYESNTTSCCQDSNNNDIADIFEDLDEDEDEDETNYKVLVGLGVTIGIGVMIAMLTSSLEIGFASMGGTAFILSQEAVGYLQMFPEAVGYGLIVVLVLIGVVLWLSN